MSSACVSCKSACMPCQQCKMSLFICGPDGPCSTCRKASRELDWGERCAACSAAHCIGSVRHMCGCYATSAAKAEDDTCPECKYGRCQDPACGKEIYYVDIEEEAGCESYHGSSVEGMLSECCGITICNDSRCNCPCESKKDDAPVKKEPECDCYETKCSSCSTKLYVPLNDTYHTPNCDKHGKTRRGQCHKPCLEDTCRNGMCECSCVDYRPRSMAPDVKFQLTPADTSDCDCSLAACDVCKQLLHIPLEENQTCGEHANSKQLRQGRDCWECGMRVCYSDAKKCQCKCKQAPAVKLEPASAPSAASPVDPGDWSCFCSGFSVHKCVDCGAQLEYSIEYSDECTHNYGKRSDYHECCQSYTCQSLACKCACRLAIYRDGPAPAKQAAAAATVAAPVKTKSSTFDDADIDYDEAHSERNTEVFTATGASIAKEKKQEKKKASAKKQAPAKAPLPTPIPTISKKTDTERDKRIEAQKRKIADMQKKSAAETAERIAKAKKAKLDVKSSVAPKT